MTCAKPGKQQWALRFEEGPVAGGFTTRLAGNLHFTAKAQHAVTDARERVM